MDGTDQTSKAIRTCRTRAKTFSQLKTVMFGISTIFGTTYICEQTFSYTEFIIKSILRTHLNNVSLDNFLKL